MFPAESLLAPEALGALDDVTDSPSFIGEPSMPNDGRHTRCREAVRPQQILYDALLNRQDPDSV